MKKLLPILVIIALVGIGGYAFLSRGTDNTSNTAMDTTKEAAPEDTLISDSFTGSLADAVKLGVGMKCTYEVEGNEYEGYIKGENYRGKMKTAEGNVGEVILKDNCMWTWAEEEAQGIKTCFEETDTDTSDIWEQPQGTVPGMTYKCVPTAVTEAKFTPPTDIDFMDLDAMKEGLGF